MSKLIKDISSRYRAREKQMVKDNLDNYMTATTEDYSQYMSGKSPSFVKYYQIDINSTTMDETLRNMTDHIGDESPILYNIINDFTLYIDSAIQIQNDISEYGLISEINGEALVVPGTLRPQVGDHFKFDLDENLGEINHVTFRITDVQTSGPTIKKFYRVMYELSDISPEELETQKTVEEFEMVYDNVGTGETKSIVKQSDFKLATACNVVADALIKEYTDQYYDEDLDLFTLETDSDYYLWDAYLHEFIRKNNILEYDEKKIMTEFYLMKFPEKEFKDYFKRKTYKKTLFRKIETKSTKLDYSLDVLSVREGELNNTKLLPFFNSVNDYKYVVHGEYDPFGSLYPYCDEYEKAPAIVAVAEPEDADEGDIWFKTGDKGLPTPMIMDIDGEWAHHSLSKRIIDNTLYDDIDDRDFLLENTIISYMNNTLDMTMEKLDELNEFEYEFEQKDYYIIPIIIYILKDISKEIIKP